MDTEELLIAASKYGGTISGTIAICGGITNGISLSYFARKRQEGLGNRFLVYLNIIDTLMCCAVAIQQYWPGPPRQRTVCRFSMASCPKVSPLRHASNPCGPFNLCSLLSAVSLGPPEGATTHHIVPSPRWVCTTRPVGPVPASSTSGRPPEKA